MPAASASNRQTFPRSRRLSLDREYQAVYAARVRKARGPITVFARPNGLTKSRLGLSVGRRVGNAVVRNSIKRRLREAFRLGQHGFPQGYDFVVNVQKHEVGPTAEYQRLLGECANALEKEWEKRRAQDGKAVRR